MVAAATAAEEAATRWRRGHRQHVAWFQFDELKHDVSQLDETGLQQCWHDDGWHDSGDGDGGDGAGGDGGGGEGQR